MKSKRHWVWVPPTFGQIKVNIDVSFLGGTGRGGIGGIFRNSNGRVLIQFGKQVSTDSVVHAEIMALREGLVVAATWQWASSHSFMFE